MQTCILPLLVAVLAFSLNSFRTTTDVVACSNTHQTGTIHDNTMTNAWIPIRNRGRGRAPFNTGGRRPPRGRCNTFDPTSTKAATREGLPIANRLSTSLYNNSTTNDTLALFLQLTQKYPAYHIITVSREHVIQFLWRPHTPKITLSIPKCYSHNNHPRSPLRGTAALVKLHRLALGHRKTHLIHYYYSHGCSPHKNAKLRTPHALEITTAKITPRRPPADYCSLPKTTLVYATKSILKIHPNSRHSQP